MKHLKKFNEEFTSFYDRTVGFRYSKPDISIGVTIYFTGNILSEEDIRTLLDDIDVPVDNIRIEEKREIVQLPSLDEEEGEVRKKSRWEKFKDRISGNEEVITSDGVITFEMKVYNEKEVDRILKDLAKSMIELGTTPVTGTSKLID